MRFVAGNHVPDPPFAGAENMGDECIRCASASVRRVLVDQLITKPVDHCQHAVE